MDTAAGKPKTVLAWSSGKDSAWALHRLRQDGDVQLTGLLTTVNEAFDRVAMHAVRSELLERQAAELGLPLYRVPIPWPCSNEDYERIMAETMEALIEKEGLSRVAFGDLYLEDIRSYRETQLEKLGIKPIFPLWGEDTAELAAAMIDAGSKAILTCIDPRKLPPDFAGRNFDYALLQSLPGDVDPCGENGEFHTFAWAGPVFRRDIRVERGAIIHRDGFVFADLRPV